MKQERLAERANESSLAAGGANSSATACRADCAWSAVYVCVYVCAYVCVCVCVRVHAHTRALLARVFCGVRMHVHMSIIRDKREHTLCICAVSHTLIPIRLIQ
jgi:hypothetical protein